MKTVFGLWLTKILIVAFALSPMLGEAARKKAKPSFRRPSAAAPVVNDTGTLERIYRLEDQRIGKDPYLLRVLYSNSNRAIRASLVALGHIGDPYAVEDLAKILNRKNREFQILAAFALGQIGNEIATRILEQQVQWQKDADLRAALFVAIGRAGREGSLKTVARTVLTEDNPQVIEAACQALGLLFSGDSVKWELPEGLLAKLVTIAKSNTGANLTAAFALSRYKGAAQLLPQAEIISAIAASPSLSAKALLIRTLGKIKSAPVAGFLSAVLNNSGNLQNGPVPIPLVIETLKSIVTQEPSEAILNSIKNPLASLNSSVVIAALDALSFYGSEASALSPNLDNLLKGSSSQWVRENALKTLARVDAKTARTRVNEILATPNNGLRSAAIASLAILGSKEDLVRVGSLFLGEPARTQVDVLDGLLGLEGDAFFPALIETLKKSLEKPDIGLTSQIGLLVEKHHWKDFANPLASLYKQFSSPDAIEGKVAILNALAIAGDVSHVPLLESALKENDKLVVSAAVAAIKALTGKDESAKIPINSRVSGATPSLSEIQNTSGKVVVLNTSRGEVQIQLNSEAPIWNSKFLKLVRSGFYNGKSFHRLVPNFVVQGGDPRGDGYGGPGFLVRDEVGTRRHLTGTVGLATAGRDTGGCQFFVNLAPNLHLDGRYTLFAEVVKGMDVVEKWEVGDVIQSARVR